jgi:hypothetical protein
MYIQNYTTCKFVSPFNHIDRYREREREMDRHRYADIDSVYYAQMHARSWGEEAEGQEGVKGMERGRGIKREIERLIESAGVRARPAESE